jgi:hypothetical protein
MDGMEVARRVVDVPARGERETQVTVRASQGAKLMARVEPADGAKDSLLLDDEATITEAAKKPPAAILVGTFAGEEETTAFFVEKALAATGVREVVRRAPDVASNQVRTGDVLVALSVGPSSKLDVPAIYLGTKKGALPYGEPRDLDNGRAHLRSVEAHEPLLRGVALDGLAIERAAAIAPPAGSRALVDLDGGTVVVSSGAGHRAWIYFGVDPARSDVVLRVAFPVFIANAVSALSGASRVAVADTLPRSEIALVPDAPAVHMATPTTPEATTSLVPEPDARWRLPIGPPILLAIVAAALLLAEAWMFKRGWAT